MYYTTVIVIVIVIVIVTPSGGEAKYLSDCPRMLKKNQRYNFLKFFFPIPIRLVPPYTLPAKDIRLLGKFQLDSF